MISAERVTVLGAAGSGKTTLAQRVSSELSIPHYELDGLRTTDESLNRHTFETITTGERWVIDGVTERDMLEEVIVNRSDLIIWLNISPLVTIPRVIMRSLDRIRRGSARPEGVGHY